MIPRRERILRIARQSLDEKRREVRLGFLIEAYRNLESASSRDLTEDLAQKIESAMRDIQLFGSAAQAEKTKEIARAFAQTGVTSFDALLDDLRNDLRKELDLDPVSPGRVLLRINSPEEPEGK